MKAAWNLRIEATDATSCDLSTETRIQYFGDEAWRRFRLYWSLIRPFSGMLRKRLLREISRRAEASPHGRRPGATPGNDAISR